MRIKRFRATEVHGYLNFDIKFFEDINFLTGINGSGKTTVVNGISSLISPSLINLATSDYREMEIEIDNDGDHSINIWAKKENGKVQIGANKFDDVLELPILSEDVFDFTPIFKIREEQETFYRELEAKFSDHPVLKLIKDLPTPMFLDIERRLDYFHEKRTVTSQQVFRRRNPNIFKLFLHRSLAEASDMAERNFRQIKARRDKLTDDFRKKIILSSIEFENTSSSFPKIFPILDEKFFGTKDQIKQTLVTLGLQENEIDKSLNPFFKRLEDLSKILPAGGNVEKFLEADPFSSPSKKAKKTNNDPMKKITAFMDWMVNRPQYDRIIKIKKHVDEYIENSKNLNETINKYLETVNAFLCDSGKEIKFNETANLIVKFKNSDEKSITALASGESQIVVILTHLFFNPDAKTANVFIVDEPELSLHVRWQELFVEAIRTANPNLQLILATHSPSIILGDIEHCIDLSGGNN